MRGKLSQRNTEEIKDKAIIGSVQLGEFELFGILIERHEKSNV